MAKWPAQHAQILPGAMFALLMSNQKQCEDQQKENMFCLFPERWPWKQFQQLEATGCVCLKRLSFCHAQFFHATNSLRVSVMRRTLSAVTWRQISGFLSHKSPL